jgi:rhodanese-related sulfurtransferase
MPRWAWGAVYSASPITVIDRNTGLFIGDVSPAEAFGIIGSSQVIGNPVIIDVRSPEEYAAGHLQQAINIDVNTPSFIDNIDLLDKNLTYIVYCKSGYRSDSARDIMKGFMIPYTINMTGGYDQWVAAGFPVEE